MRLPRAFFLVLVLSACAPAAVTDEGDPGATSAIIGGEETKYPLQVWYLETDGPSGVAGCTATLVSPRVLLTAAHCVVHVGSTTRVRAFTGSHVTLGDGEWLAVSAVRAHPRFDPDDLYAGYDVGVAFLDKPYEALPPRAISTDSPSAWIGKRVRLVGFGANQVLANGDNVGAGVKRTSMSTVNSVDAMFVNIGDRDLAACHGDSGGPALVYEDGVPYILAITSFGYVCGSGAYYTRAGLFRAFVDEAIRDGN